MRAEVNGETVEVDDGCVIATVVMARVDTVRGVAVAVNGELVPRSAWHSTVLAPGDRVELLTAAQGG